MRIILTEKGGDLIRQMGNEKILDTLQKNLNNPLKKSISENANLDYEEKKGGINKLLDNMKNLKNLKVIEIKPKKLSIPKNIAEKYNEIKLEETSLLPVLHKKINKGNDQYQKSSYNNYNNNANILIRESAEEYKSTSNTRSNLNGEITQTDSGMKMPPLKINTNINGDFMRTSYKMKEIISDKALDNIKNNIILDVKMKNKLSNVVATNFRSPFLTPDEKLIDIEYALDKKIKSDKANIIQYLNSKNCLSPKFIKSLSNYDEEKFVRLNKICQRVFNQDGKDNDLKTKIHGIIDNMHVFEKADYKRKMNLMESEVNSIKDICEKYPKRDDREKYENLLHDIKKKYWDKINVDKSARKNLKNE